MADYKSFDVGTEGETADIARTLAMAVDAGSTVLLSGPLGAGKSVFARAFIRHLCGPDTVVPSPTFTLVQSYESSKAPLHHFDLYRLEAPEDIFEIGWEDALSTGIVLAEWPERLGPYRPVQTIDVNIEPCKGDARKITIHDKRR